MIQLTVDIDDTLAQTNLFWARHHLEIFGSPESLSAEEIIKKYRFVKYVPYWQINEGINWIETHIHSNDAKLEIPVIEEAIKIMRYLPIACYLTNRPENTNEGTKKWLKKHGFPERKIISSLKGLEWKAQKLTEMFPDVTGIVDDNSDLLQHINSHYKGNIFLYSHSNHVNCPINVILCPTWADIEKEVHKLM